VKIKADKKAHGEAPKPDERDAVIERQATRLRELSRLVEERDQKLHELRQRNEVIRVFANTLRVWWGNAEDRLMSRNWEIQALRDERDEANRRLRVCQRVLGWTGLLMVALGTYGFVSLFV